MAKEKIEVKEKVEESQVAPMVYEELPLGIFKETKNPEVFVDHYGRLFSLEVNSFSKLHFLKQLNFFPGE